MKTPGPTENKIIYFDLQYMLRMCEDNIVLFCYTQMIFPSVLWHCWQSRKSIQSVKIE